MSAPDYRPICSHCGKDLEPEPVHDYMLTAEVWDKVHPEGYRGFLHDECLQQRAADVGLTLNEDDFTECLCFVNRHIHLPTPEDVVRKLTERFHLTSAQSIQKGKPVEHYGVGAAYFLTVFAYQDIKAQQFHRRSAFAHLFRSDMQVLGTVIKPKPPIGAFS